MRSENAENLSRQLGATYYSVQTTFDLKFSTIQTDSNPGGVKYSVRLTEAKGGTLEHTVVKKNPSNVVVFDLLCLHR